MKLRRLAAPDLPELSDSSDYETDTEEEDQLGGIPEGGEEEGSSDNSSECDTDGPYHDICDAQSSTNNEVAPPPLESDTASEADDLGGEAWPENDGPDHADHMTATSAAAGAAAGSRGSIADVNPFDLLPNSDADEDSDDIMEDSDLDEQEAPGSSGGSGSGGGSLYRSAPSDEDEYDDEDGKGWHNDTEEDDEEEAGSSEGEHPGQAACSCCCCPLTEPGSDQQQPDGDQGDSGCSNSKQQQGGADVAEGGHGGGGWETAPEDAECWVCFRAAFEGADGRLVAPCATCSGSMRWMHAGCFAEWLGRSWSESCPNCRKPYVADVLRRFPDGRMLLSMLGDAGGAAGPDDPLALSFLAGGRYPSFATAHFCLGGIIQVAMPADSMTPQGLLRAVRRLADDLYRDLESQPGTDDVTGQPLPLPPSRDVDGVFVEVDDWSPDPVAADLYQQNGLAQHHHRNHQGFAAGGGGGGRGLYGVQQEEAEQPPLRGGPAGASWAEDRWYPLAPRGPRGPAGPADPGAPGASSNRGWLPVLPGLDGLPGLPLPPHMLAHRDWQSLLGRGAGLGPGYSPWEYGGGVGGAGGARDVAAERQYLFELDEALARAATSAAAIRRVGGAAPGSNGGRGAHGAARGGGLSGRSAAAATQGQQWRRMGRYEQRSHLAQRQSAQHMRFSFNSGSGRRR